MDKNTSKLLSTTRVESSANDTSGELSPVQMIQLIASTLCVIHTLNLIEKESYTITQIHNFCMKTNSHNRIQLIRQKCISQTIARTKFSSLSVNRTECS